MGGTASIDHRRDRREPLGNVGAVVHPLALLDAVEEALVDDRLTHLRDRER